MKNPIDVANKTVVVIDGTSQWYQPRCRRTLPRKGWEKTMKKDPSITTASGRYFLTEQSLSADG